jgi:hypothetical protein
VKSNSASFFVLHLAVVASLGLWLFAAAGCSSGAKSNSVAGQDAGSDSGTGHIDVMCIADRIEKPTEAYHYSFTYSTSSAWVNDEADITPQVMDIVMKDKSGSRSYHGVHSDEASWNSAVLNLSSLNITTMSARLSSLDGNSGIVSQGAEATNGYQATKYSVDRQAARPEDVRNALRSGEL